MIEKIKNLKAGGSSLKEIFDNHLYAPGSLYIL